MKKLAEEDPLKAKAEPSGNKRKADDDSGGQTKKIKTREGLRDRMVPPRQGDWPKGLHNHGLACFANAVLQCLHNIPELVEFYRAKAKDTVKPCDLTEYEKKGFKRSPKAEDLRRKFDVRKAFREAKNAM